MYIFTGDAQTVAGIRQVQWAELDPGLEVMMMPGASGLSPPLHSELRTALAPYSLFCTGVPWPSARPA